MSIAMGKEYQVTIGLSRASGSVDEFRLRLTDEASRVTFAEIAIAPELLGDLLSARGVQASCRFWSLERVGMRLETKREEVDIPRHSIDLDREERDKLYRIALAEHEIDGWLGNIDDMSNHHRRTPVRRSDGGTSSWVASVSFRRYVDDMEDKE